MIPNKVSLTVVTIISIIIAASIFRSHDVNQHESAAYNESIFRTLYRAEIVIEAPANNVWAVLMNLQTYPQWNPFTVEIQSSLNVGNPVHMQVKMSEYLTLSQTEYIRSLDAKSYKVCWGINTSTPWLNKGERCQWLESISPTQTRYITEDKITGAITPLVSLLFGHQLEKGFKGLSLGLKAFSEST